MPKVGDQSAGPSAEQAKLYAPHPAEEVMPSLWNSAQAANTTHAAARRIKVFMLWLPSVCVCRIARAEWSNAKHSAEFSPKGERSPDLEAKLCRTFPKGHWRQSQALVEKAGRRRSRGRALQTTISAQPCNLSYFAFNCSGVSAWFGSGMMQSAGHTSMH